MNLVLEVVEDEVEAEVVEEEVVEVEVVEAIGEVEVSQTRNGRRLEIVKSYYVACV